MASCRRWWNTARLLCAVASRSVPRTLRRPNAAKRVIFVESAIQEALPHVDAWLYCKPPNQGGAPMEFRLIYRGSLPSETSKPRMESKRAIRSYLSPQLKLLWSSHPRLKEFTEPPYVDPDSNWSFIERLADQHKVVSVSNHIHRFVPLVTDDNYDGCCLDILFLRRDVPGGLVKHGGDIDNRLKVLFDALRMPGETQEIEDSPQRAAENPCFCLLADDKYMDQVSVTTDRLMTPMEHGDAIHDVVLIIHVAASLFNRHWDVAPR